MNAFSHFQCVMVYTYNDTMVYELFFFSNENYENFKQHFSVVGIT